LSGLRCNASGRGLGSGAKEGRTSFLKKRSKKLLLLVRLAALVPRPAVNRSFLRAFFQKSATFL
jgi:hypothetical protein